MPSPTKHPRTGIYLLRKAIPAPLRDTAKARFGVSAELIENLGTKDPKEAKVKAPAALARLEERMEAIRAAHERMQQPPAVLTDAEIENLAARYVHQGLAEDEALRRDGSGEAALYEAVAAQVVAHGGTRRFSPDQVAAARGMSERDFTKHAETIRIVGEAAEAALARGDTSIMDDDVSAIAEAEGFHLDPASDSYRRLAYALLQAQVEVLDAMDRRHSRQLVRTPPEPPALAIGPAQRTAADAGAPAGGCPMDELLLGWSADRGVVGMEAIKGDRNSYDRMRTMERLAAFVGHRDASKITKADAVRWKADMQTRNLAAATIRNDLSEMSAIWRWGIANGKVEVNHFAGILPPKQKKRRTEKRPFTDAEATLLLNAARAEKGTMRWLPWLLAFTGARLREVVQSVKEDVTTRDGVLVLRIHDEGEKRRVKNESSARVVPLHPALLAEGFGAYVAALPRGASLFPDLPTSQQFGHKGDTGSKKIGYWVRKLGITDKHIQPAHAWRHWFITACRKVPLPEEVRDAITGHAGRISESSNYGDSMRSLVQQLNTWMVQVAPPEGLTIAAPAS